MRTCKTYWVLNNNELDRWHEDAEQVQARSMEDAAEMFARDSGVDQDDDELDVVVSEDKAGSNAKRFTVRVEVTVDYMVMASDEEVHPPSAEESDPEDCDRTPPVDTRTLPLFGE